jgi:hypothetical protein
MITFGACDDCDAMLLNGALCVGRAVVPGVDAESWTSFGGPYTEGDYLVKYCGGTFNESVLWQANRPPAAYRGGYDPYSLIEWNGGANSGGVSAPQPGPTQYSTPAAAEAADRCSQIIFHHTSGTIQLHWREYLYEDNTAGTPLPTYALYKMPPPCLALVSAVGSGSGNNYSAVFTFAETCGGSGLHTKFTLDASGGITSPSGPAYVDVAPSGTFTVTFTWHGSPSGNNVVTATIHAQLPDGTNLADMVIEVAPTLVTTVDYHHSGGSYCGFEEFAVGVKLQNIGNQNTQTLVASFHAVSGCALLDTYSCAVVDPRTWTVGVVTQGTFYYADIVQRIKNDGTGATNAVFDIVYTDNSGAVTHPTARITLPWAGM